MEAIKLSIPGDNDYMTQEAYKVLRTNIQFCGPDIRVISITSCDENEGKSIISLHLAKSLAELGKKVLLIDADMRKSVIAGRNTNVRHPVGLSELLTGMTNVQECVYPTQMPGLNIMFAGQYPPNPAELLGQKNFGYLLDEARKVYDYVIVDTPPLGRVIDAAVVAPKCDGTVLVLGGKNVRRRQVQDVIAQLKKGNCKILGVVRNKVSPKNSAYYEKKKR